MLPLHYVTGILARYVQQLEAFLSGAFTAEVIVSTIICLAVNVLISQSSLFVLGFKQLTWLGHLEHVTDDILS